MTEAKDMRKIVGSILGRSADDSVLAPGALVALRLFLQERDARSVLLSDREYYGPEHFPGLTVTVAPMADLATAAERTRPDLVLASLVSWRGDLADIQALASDLGLGERSDAPLLCVDWCHAGAAGFPSAEGLAADLVIGDATKWLTPASEPDRVAFLFALSDRVGDLAEAFSGLYLSGAPDHPRSARWVDPGVLDEMRHAVPEAALDLDRRTAWHDRNLELARRVARANGAAPPDTAIVWLPERSREDCDLSELPSEGLAWETCGGVRILCQAGPLD